MPKGYPNKRAENVRQERRREPGSLSTGLKLSVDESKLDRDTYQYRFVNDKGVRVQQLAADDWDLVTEPVKADGNGLGSVPSTHAGIQEDGKPYNAVLMQKRKDWFEADQKEKQRPLDEMEEAIRRGVDSKATLLRGTGVYTPTLADGVPINKIERA